MNLTGHYEQTESGMWIAWVEEIPGANTQGATLEEAKENLRDALDCLLESYREFPHRASVESGPAVREPLRLAA